MEKVKFPELRLSRLIKDREEKERLEDEQMDYCKEEKKIPSTNVYVNRVYPGVKVKQRSYMTNDYVIVEHNGLFYPVIRIKSKGSYFPLVIDLDQLDKILTYTVQSTRGNWNLTNKYVTFSVKTDGVPQYLHNVIMDRIPDGSGKDSIDHLNRVILDNRRVNLKLKSQSDQNVNQRVRKCMSTKLDLLPKEYRDYYLENRPRYIYWLHSATHGNRVIAGPVGPIKEKKFSSTDSSELPSLIKIAEDYLFDEAKKLGLDLAQISSELTKEAYILKREYDQIIKKASFFFTLS